MISSKKCLQIVISFLKKEAFALIKVLSLYLFVCFFGLFVTKIDQAILAPPPPTQDFEKDNASIVCALTFSFLEPFQKSNHECEGFKNSYDIQKRGVASEDLIEGQCPDGYRLSRTVYQTVCIKTEKK